MKNEEVYIKTVKIVEELKVIMPVASTDDSVPKEEVEQAVKSKNGLAKKHIVNISMVWNLLVFDIAVA